MAYYIQKTVNKTIVNIDWLMQTMDVTQWGMVATTVVVLGFLALKSRK